MAEKTASVLTDDIQNKVNVKLQSVRRTVVSFLFIFTICNYMYIITESVKKKRMLLSILQIYQSPAGAQYYL